MTDRLETYGTLVKVIEMYERGQPDEFMKMFGAHRTELHAFVAGMIRERSACISEYKTDPDTSLLMGLTRVALNRIGAPVGASMGIGEFAFIGFLTVLLNAMEQDFQKHEKNQTVTAEGLENPRS